MNDITLSKPAVIAGNEATKLVMDLDELKGSDIMTAQSEFNRANQGFVGVAEMQPEYQARLAACALGCTFQELAALPARDFMAVTGAVYGFLFEPGLEGGTKS